MDSESLAPGCNNISRASSSRYSMALRHRVSFEIISVSSEKVWQSYYLERCFDTVRPPLGRGFVRDVTSGSSTPFVSNSRKRSNWTQTCHCQQEWPSRLVSLFFPAARTQILFQRKRNEHVDSLAVGQRPRTSNMGLPKAFPTCARTSVFAIDPSLHSAAVLEDRRPSAHGLSLHDQFSRKSSQSRFEGLAKIDGARCISWL